MTGLALPTLASAGAHLLVGMTFRAVVSHPLLVDASLVVTFHEDGLLGRVSALGSSTQASAFDVPFSGSPVIEDGALEWRFAATDGSDTILLGDRCHFESPRVTFCRGFTVDPPGDGVWKFDDVRFEPAFE